MSQYALHTVSLSSVPVVGCRNGRARSVTRRPESIKRSGGGVSELFQTSRAFSVGVYQAFRWWGVGTHKNELPAYT